MDEARDEIMAGAMEIEREIDNLYSPTPNDEVFMRQDLKIKNGMLTQLRLLNLHLETIVQLFNE